MIDAGAWCAVALSADIEPGMSAGTRLDGAELVVWRDQAGQPHVWEDRCPHRGMRLSFGFVRGDRLACLYHGWRFDGAGRCRLIPAHPALAVPSSIRATTHDCIERLGMIWTRPAEADAAPVAWDAPVEAVPVRSIAIGCAASRVRAALPGRPAPVATLMAVQQLTPDRSMLHLTLLHAVCAGAAQSAVRLAVCDWSEALRDILETGA